MTLTIEIAETDLIRARDRGLDPAYLARVAQEAVTDAIEGHDTTPVDPETVESIRQGIAEADAGRTISFEEYKAEGRAFTQSRATLHRARQGE